jgi:hypothetical protein
VATLLSSRSACCWLAGIGCFMRLVHASCSSCLPQDGSTVVSRWVSDRKRLQRASESLVKMLATWRRRPIGGRDRLDMHTVRFIHFSGCFLQKIPYLRRMQKVCWPFSIVLTHSSNQTSAMHPPHPKCQQLALMTLCKLRTSLLGSCFPQLCVV